MSRVLEYCHPLQLLEVGLERLLRRWILLELLDSLFPFHQLRLARYNLVKRFHGRLERVRLALLPLNADMEELVRQ